MEKFFSRRIEVGESDRPIPAPDLLSRLEQRIRRNCSFQGRTAPFFLERTESYLRIGTVFLYEFWYVGLYVENHAGEDIYTYKAAYYARGMGKIDRFFNGPFGCLLMPLGLLFGLVSMPFELHNDHQKTRREATQNEILSVFDLSLSKVLWSLDNDQEGPRSGEIDSQGSGLDEV